jgi:hypothetical protein
MRQRFEQVKRNHHPRDSFDAEVETTQHPSTTDHLQRELDRILEVIDQLLEDNADLDHRA